jgi:hemolysin activation/secretion protein
LGIGAEICLNRIDNLINPQSGWEFKLSCVQSNSAIKRNSTIENLISSGYDYSSLYDLYKLNRNQFLLKTNAVFYFKIMKHFILKTAITSGIIEEDNLFQNQLYQIGGYTLLRGFNEQSIFAKDFFVESTEFRIPFDEYSFCYVFNDNGYIVSTNSLINFGGWYQGYGIGATFHVKNGLFNVSYSVGSSPQTPIQLRDSKIHFGLVSLF